jgi:hypothetical protein
VVLEQGQYDRAAPLLGESLRLAGALGSRERVACALRGIASLAAARSRPIPAARLHGAAEALREAAGVTVSRVEHAIYERHLDLARSRLDADAWAAERAAGAAWSLEQVVAAAEETLELVAPAAARLQESGAER